MSANQDAIREPSSIPSIVIIVLLVITLAGLGGAIFINLSDQAEDGRYRTIGGELRVNLQQIFSGARLAVEGDEQAFSNLERAQQQFDSSMRLLANGSSDLTALREWLPGEYRALNQEWSDVSGSIDTILANQDRILFLHEVASTLNESIPELQQEYNLVVDILVESGSQSDQAVLAQRQALLGERIARNIDKMLDGGTDAADAADQFNLDASLFGSVLSGMIDGNAAMRIDQVSDEEALESLTQIDELFAFVNNSVDKIFQASPDLLNTRQSVDLILGSAGSLNSQLDGLVASVDSISEQRLLKQFYIYGIAALAVVLVIALAVLASVNARRRLEMEEQTNEASQRAILTLLDELADLADGDLRTKATVTEEFTGAIADSVNFTIDQLRVLVSRITESSMSISGASVNAQSISEELSSAADQQAAEIAEATLSINEMAETIDGVSNQAADSANVATRSVDIAKNGATVVRNTIGGMDTIREQIQDTSKRIKRLGESSQEIGDIVSLINDIADQTNILSLNAAIQASMAGDAGRGFAVVADEVQRLAERSSAATKQIEALVKTIQTDTNEAVISMEQTTTEVVRGARLAQDAGVALEEIETVSTDIASLIQRISESARSQAQKATQVSERMNIIQDITTQTSSGTKATTDSIGELLGLSVDMRDSVAGFTLPVGVAQSETAEGLEEDTELADDLAESEVAVEGDNFELPDGDGDELDGIEVSELEDLETGDVDSIDEDSIDVELDEDLADVEVDDLDALEGFEADDDESFEETVQFDAIETVQVDSEALALPEEEIAADDDELDGLDAADLDDFDLDDFDESDESELELTAEAVDDDIDDIDLSFDEEPEVQAEASDDSEDDDDFNLALDDDFDLDLDEFSFDEEEAPQKA